MSDVNGAAAPAAAPETGPLTLHQAAAAYAERRKKETEPQAASGDESRQDAPQQDSPQGDAGPDDSSVPGETNDIDQVDVSHGTEPPIDAPRSWSKEDKEIFNGLPRETQQRLAERERSRETDFLRRQNEASEKLKGLTAKERGLEETRQQYETALPLLLNSLQGQIAGEFADIRTMQDVQKMSVEDWPRYIRWDANQKQIAAVQQEIGVAQQRQQVEYQSQFAKYAEAEDQAFTEAVPEFKDKAKAEKLQTEARKVLANLGFKDEELVRAWNGQGNLSLRDHRVQKLIHDAVKYRQAEAARANLKPATKPIPQVQRPGVARPAGAADAERIEALSKRLDKTGDIRVAAQLYAARKAARSA